MARTLTLAELNGENALTIVGTIAGLLRKLDRKLGTDYRKQYRAEAMTGDYTHLCTVSERYALQFLASTLQAREGDLTNTSDESEVCDHCGVATTSYQERECDDCTDRILGN